VGAIRLVGWAVIAVAVCAAAAMLVPSALGYERYVLVGKSMEPTIQRGSLIFDETVPTRSLRVGHVITYQPPGHAKPFTHRIIGIKAHKRGRVFTTKGDNNTVKDPIPFQLDQPKQARFRFAVPYVGWLFIWLANPTHRFIALGVPALLIALINLAKVTKDVRNSRRIHHHA
jgi:signal peptidase